MHASLLTLLLATGVAQSCSHGEQAMASAGGCTAPTCQPGYSSAPCNPYGDWWQGCLSLCLGPMPQTCYDPRFGCYPGSSRRMNRYPAFHGYYYRQTYNYRQLFDYPWHATPHGPQGYFACQCGGH